MRRLEAAAATDTGRTRSRNEDAYHKGESVFAVADGMGGHLAGDVASVTALMPIQGLDARVFPDATTARAELLDAILAANSAVVRKAASEPGLQGMGTTLTATIVEGRRLHVGHVGDSRAYLVRDGDVTQLTRDHTLVAHLIEEGQITKEEAAVHPQRSIITRAIGVDVDLDVDTLTIDLLDGDQVLLCSDGLTGPVSDEAILDVLTNVGEIEVAVQDLIDAANAQGGPDNITVVLLRYHEDDPREPVAAPASSARVIRPDAQDAKGDDWAQQLGRLGAMGRPAEAGGQPAEPRGTGRWQRIGAIALVLVLLAAIAGLGGRWLLSRSFFVGLEGDRVVILHGIPASLGPLELAWVAEETDLRAGDVAPWYVRRLEEGVPAADLVDARQIVRSAPRSDDAEPDDEPTGDATPSPSPGTTS